MTSAPTRRPLPALVFLVALCLLTALVWWRVLHSDSSHASGSAPCIPQSTPSGLPRPAEITVSVYNGTQRNGLAKSTSAALRKDGFHATVGGNTTRVPGVAELRYTRDDESAATVLSYYLPGAKLVRVTTASADTVVVRLGATYKALAPARTVHAAMARAHTSFAPVVAAGDAASSVIC